MPCSPGDSLYFHPQCSRVVLPSQDVLVERFSRYVWTLLLWDYGSAAFTGLPRNAHGKLLIDWHRPWKDVTSHLSKPSFAGHDCPVSNARMHYAGAAFSDAGHRRLQASLLQPMGAYCNVHKLANDSLLCKTCYNNESMLLAQTSLAALQGLM